MVMAVPGTYYHTTHPSDTHGQQMRSRRGCGIRVCKGGTVVGRSLTFMYWRKVGLVPIQFLYKLLWGLQSNQNAAFGYGQLSPNQHTCTQVFIHSMYTCTAVGTRLLFNEA